MYLAASSIYRRFVRSFTRGERRYLESERASCLQAKKFTATQTFPPESRVADPDQAGSGCVGQFRICISNKIKSWSDRIRVFGSDRIHILKKGRSRIIKNCRIRIRAWQYPDSKTDLLVLFTDQSYNKELITIDFSSKEKGAEEFNWVGYGWFFEGLVRFFLEGWISEPSLIHPDPQPRSPEREGENITFGPPSKFIQNEMKSKTVRYICIWNVGWPNVSSPLAGEEGSSKLR